MRIAVSYDGYGFRQIFADRLLRQFQVKILAAVLKVQPFLLICRESFQIIVAAGIAYIEGQPLEVLGQIVVNAISTIGGMVCDGAKSSCAAKIATSISTGFLAYDLAVNGLSFKAGEGLVVEDIEETIARIGRMGREGMRSTDESILQMLLK